MENNAQELAEKAKIEQKLAAIQAALKAPKSQYNEFGRYSYRKAEDILEAVKPLLAANGCVLTCSDELLLIGTRYYIKATATLIDTENGGSLFTTAYAREEDEKKGMDGSQITGASSSYARKYALNGLFCIDDTADSDTTNLGNNKPAPQPQPAGTARRIARAVVTTHSTPQWDNRAKWVEAIALGKKTKSGRDSLEAYVANYKPSEDELERLNYDVAVYRQEHGIAAPAPETPAAQA